MQSFLLIMIANLHFSINEKLYNKNPESSSLGKKIIQQSIILIDEIGFESFTFKKLGEKIGSNESSIYRYFDNKHKLLIYLSDWYWSWVEYKMVFSIQNIEDPFEKLKRIVKTITEKPQDDFATQHINEEILHRIIVSEFVKTILTKEVDEENKEGYFFVYKRIITRIVALMEENNPNYVFSKSLASSIVEGALHQHYLSQHLKTITSCNSTVSTSDFYIDLISKMFQK